MHSISKKKQSNRESKKSPKLQALLERPNFAQYLADKGDVVQS